MSRRLLLRTMEEVALFSTLNPEMKKRIAKSAQERRFRNGQELMRQGDRGNEFFVIAQGECDVIVTDQNTQKRTKVATLRNGDYAGEQALLSGAVRNATVVARKDTICFVLDKLAFDNLTKSMSGGGKSLFDRRNQKRMAISAELMGSGINNNNDNNNDDKNNHINNIDPSLKEKSLDKKKYLMNCIKDNILFTKLDTNQRSMIIDEMYRVECQPQETLIKQGDSGHLFYVLENGKMSIRIHGQGEVAKIISSDCVGELALMYNAPRAATVIALEPCKLWAVHRLTFRKVIQKSSERERKRHMDFLKRIEMFKQAGLSSHELRTIDQALDTKKIRKGTTVMTLGDEGDKFFIIRAGRVNGILQNKETFTLGKGDYFGERALIRNEPRAATITCITDCVFLTLTRREFSMLLGPLEEIMKRGIEAYDDPSAAAAKKRAQSGAASQRRRSSMGAQRLSNGRLNIPTAASAAAAVNPRIKKVVGSLKDLRKTAILGKGAFGTVWLTKDLRSDNQYYALKSIRKNLVVESGQTEHVLNEKRVMEMMDHSFLVNLCGTYKDEYRVYFLLELCQGGELFSLLRKKRSFDEPTAKFYAACVIEAFSYMHSLEIVYRDLKPENLVLCENGYIKVADFGFAKVLSEGQTFTLCGTPDYLAPEIVSGSGHSFGVDWWTLGVLIYEMLASFPPFYDDNQLQTYRKIIQGKVKYPRYSSAHAKDLISKFLKGKPTRRFGVLKGGAQLIRSHPWFKDFNWRQLQKLGMQAPFIPHIQSAGDISNFDQFQEEEEDLTYKGDPMLGWDDEF